MFARCVLVIVVMAACGLALLAARQARVQAAHELAETRLRIARADEQLWRLRAQLARQLTPGAVDQLADRAGTLQLASRRPGAASASQARQIPHDD